MSLLVSLKSFFAERPSVRPDSCPDDFERGGETGDSDHLEPVVGTDDDDVGHDLVGVSFGMEYVDAGGHVTRRWITVHGFRESTDGNHLMSAHCYLRAARRTFRLDHIRTIFDSDGVVYQPDDFFTLPGLDFGPASRRLDGPGVRQRREGRDAIRVLVALARIDGHLHPDELEVILGYIEARCAAARIPYDSSDREALCLYIKRLHPDGPVTARSLSGILVEAETVKKEFLFYATKVMNADGIQDPAEAAFMIDLSNEIKGCV